MLYIFVEGFDDEDYFKKIFGASFGEHKIIQYAQKPKDKVENFLKSIKCMPDSDYLFFADEDGKGIENKRCEIASTYNELDSQKIIIVQYEIESWYYAGVSLDICKKLKIAHYQFNSDTLTKEQLYNKFARQSDRRYIMAEMLNSYSLELAITRNTTLNSFFEAIKKEPAAVS